MFICSWWILIQGRSTGPDWGHGVEAISSSHWGSRRLGKISPWKNRGGQVLQSGSDRNVLRHASENFGYPCKREIILLSKWFLPPSARLGLIDSSARSWQAEVRVSAAVNVLGVFQATCGKSPWAWQPETTDRESLPRFSASLTGAGHEKGSGDKMGGARSEISNCFVSANTGGVWVCDDILWRNSRIWGYCPRLHPYWGSS